MAKHRPPTILHQAPTRATRPASDLPAKFQQAVAFHKAGRFAEAEPLYWEIVDRDPFNADAHHNLGLIAYQAGHNEPAVEHIAQSIRLNPRNAAPYSNLGLVYQTLGRLDEALANLDKAVERKPDFADAWFNRGNVLWAMLRLEEALASYERAVRLDPRQLKALANRGLVLRDLGRLDEALDSFASALAVDPDFAVAHLYASFTHLLGGDFAAGWPEYEWRWREAQLASARREFAQPLWLGREPLAGRRILLHAEQGFGDTIQFCRYAALVAAQGGEVILEVQPPLQALLAGLAGVRVGIARGEPLPAFDLQTPLLSLPLAFGTRLDTIPASPAYLRADPALVSAWQAKLGERRRRRVGLVWSGNSEYKKDTARSIPFGALGPLLAADVEWVSLQKDLRPEDVDPLRGTRIRHFGPALGNFADTAALIECVDEVISVDTAVAHLAGALGKPLRILLPHAPDWRWLRDREDTPWYPTARLLRQPAPGDWRPVIDRVARELASPADRC